MMIVIYDHRIFIVQGQKLITFLVHNLQIFVISYSSLSLASLSSLVYCLWARPGAYPRVEHLKGSSIRQVPALPTNIRPGWKGLPGTNTLTYWAHSSVIKRKEGCEYDTTNLFFVLMTMASLALN
jgi:hypothetical protein